MKTAKIYAPGIVLGRHPERRAHEPSSALVRKLSGMLDGQHGTQRRGDAAFVSRVRDLQRELALAPTPALADRILRLRARLACDGFAGEALAESFAVAAVSCQRGLGVDLYDTQFIAARIMLDGHLAEMATGEGKTLAAAVAASVAALAGMPVHVVTANDYLVARDAAGLRPVYEALGLTVGAVTTPMDTAARSAAYSCDITYCTAKELVFDYLRDSVSAPRVSELEQRAVELTGGKGPRRVLRGLCMAIIDEADSILIDEARVPLVLSRSRSDTGHECLQRAWAHSASLELGIDFHLDMEARSPRLTQTGRERLRALAGTDTVRWLSARHCEDTVALALAARHMLLRGRDFVVEDGRVHIVDPTTGRKAHGRWWSRGLHQLVEIKEGCARSASVVTLTQITYQRFFPRYFRLCGMSGTLMESRHELHGIYGLRVVPVPLRRPCRRELLPSRVFASAEAQWSAVAARVRELHELGRPVLIGTDSVADSEAVSRILNACSLTHAVLNARQDHDEAEIIARAGAPRAITVATNMAGRGTDIVLAPASRDAGGMHVICCQQNAARRIDRQLVGRSARQGDPGSAEFFVSLEGPLLAHSRIAHLLRTLWRQGELAQPRWGALAAQRAQLALERRHRRERSALMRRDQRVDDWFAFSGPEQ